MPGLKRVVLSVVSEHWTGGSKDLQCIPMSIRFLDPISRYEPYVGERVGTVHVKAPFFVEREHEPEYVKVRLHLE